MDHCHRSKYPRQTPDGQQSQVGWEARKPTFRSDAHKGFIGLWASTKKSTQNAWRCFISVCVRVCQQICSFNTNILTLCTLCVSVHYVMLCTGISRENFPCKKAEQSRTDQSSVKLCWDIYIQLRRSKWGGKVKWNWDAEKYWRRHHPAGIAYLFTAFSALHIYLQHFQLQLDFNDLWPPDFQCSLAAWVPSSKDVFPARPQFLTPLQRKKIVWCYVSTESRTAFKMFRFIINAY